MVCTTHAFELSPFKILTKNYFPLECKVSPSKFLTTVFFLTKAQDEILWSTKITPVCAWDELFESTDKLIPAWAQDKLISTEQKTDNDFVSTWAPFKKWEWASLYLSSRSAY